MVYTYPLSEKNMDLSSSIAKHSGDETFAYKMVEEVPVCMSVYYPAHYEKENRYPAFFLIHGGGWSSHKIFDGEVDWQGDHLGYLARYYADKGFVCISIDYRLMQENGQKENYQLIDVYSDCVDAVDYVLDRAGVYGIDMENVFILGESAGGHLAGLLATRYKRRGFLFQQAFLVNAITDLEDDAKCKRYVPSYSTHPELADLQVCEYAEFLSPLYHIGQDTCKVVLIHGMEDTTVPPMHSERFYQRMIECGRECELHWIENAWHAFLLAEHSKQQEACRIGIEIIDSYLESVSLAEK